ncbi:cdp-diacylglycerol--inositol 3-phosphatidyltransferase [Chlorella sorokiniana]|uniref:Cdp-diacylglycerol--inositol 3-phosphatidyltransferase n=1 Tax=Chlorella sorokiniana TaxID=3076 RepID=A0A2P6TSP3_CHLSO|nr:cdp-diacylglycerol--inositol 3-phosphatidyltransferase [Chlorella sorokiniana]|eukprot:PRW57079.1 cdp-diacylglycerol--inositol 3-phosphatidyltransferase [Chlorella sorokiniana]
MLLLLLALRTVAVERLYGLAAMAALHSLVLEALALLASRCPARYVPQRRWIITLAIAHLSATIHLLSMRGGMNIFALASSSPIHLLFWMCIGNGAFYTALYAVHSQLSVSWSWRALPALAVLPMLRGGALCVLLLRAPGAELALRRLFHLLELLHCIPILPLAQLSASNLPPASQCRAINAWAALMIGAAVPLAIQAVWELARWRAFQQQRAAAAAAAAAARAGTSAEHRAGAVGATAEDEQQEGAEFWHAPVSAGHRLPVILVLCSSLVWCLAVLAEG